MKADSHSDVFQGFASPHNVADVKRTEFSVSGRGFIESHRVHDFLDMFRSAAPQGDAPFPVVKASGRRDQLRNATREFDPGSGMFGHE